MDKNRSELFGQFSYDDGLTYEQLLGIEAALISSVEELMPRAGGTHLDFTPMGDVLMFQCVFEAHKIYVYRKIAQEFAGLLPEGVGGRLLCVNKSLEALHLYWISPGQWQEEERILPQRAPEGLKTWPAAPRDALNANADDSGENSENATR